MTWISSNGHPQKEFRTQVAPIQKILPGDMVLVGVNFMEVKSTVHKKVFDADDDRGRITDRRVSEPPFKVLIQLVGDEGEVFIEDAVGKKIVKLHDTVEEAKQFMHNEAQYQELMDKHRLLIDNIEGFLEPRDDRMKRTAESVLRDAIKEKEAGLL